jgi:RND family efflux transporter MFP subunit
MSLFQRSTERVGHFFKTTPKRYTIGGAVIIVALIAVGLHFLNRAPTAAAIVAQVPHVTLASVASLSSNNTSALPVTGTVSSLHQATILAQSSGQVNGVYASLGSVVSAGEVIARLENASQAAAVVQAQGSYAAAQAALALASGTTAQNSSATASQASQSAANTQASAVATLQSTYTSLDDAVHTRSDALFTNPRGSNPTLLGFTVPDSQLVQTIQNERLGLEAVLTDARSVAAESAPANIDATIAQMNTDVQAVGMFLNNMVTMINQAVPNQMESAAAISAAQTSLSTGRSEVVATVSALTSAKNAYDAAVAGATTAANSATGGTQSSVAGAQANVQVALGALDAAQANLEKTVIRSPLSGTIIDLPVKIGNYLNTGSEAAIVSNASALQVVTNVTAADAKTLAVGGKATIEGTASGVITSIAPALNPTTNEIEVDIGITAGASSLTDGQSVTVELSRTNTSGTARANSTPVAITIPIVALKITPQGPVVFTVDASSTLVAVPVTLGSILGDQVTILKGLAPSTIIVQDARGHVAGDVVTVDAQ